MVPAIATKANSLMLREYLKMQQNQKMVNLPLRSTDLSVKRHKTENPLFYFICTKVHSEKTAAHSAFCIQLSEITETASDSFSGRSKKDVIHTLLSTSTDSVPLDISKAYCEIISPLMTRNITSSFC